MVKHLIVGCLFSMAIGFAHAETLRDPTMPANLTGAAAQANGLSNNAAPVLQSVTLGSELKYAMINGKNVKLGTRFERFTLVKLSANQATLKAADGTLQILKMDFAIQQTAPDKALKIQTTTTAKPLKTSTEKDSSSILNTEKLISTNTIAPKSK